MRIKLVLWLFFIPLILSATIIDFEEPVIEKNMFQNDLPQTLIPGQPMMSYIPVKILLPMGEKLLSLEIRLQNQGETLENVYIDYARKMQPISLSRPDDTKKDNSVYTTNEFYPAYDYKGLGTQRLKGYDLVLINIYPYKYNPVTGKIKWFKNAEVNFTSEYDNRKYKQQNNLLLLDSTNKSKISKLVINSEELSTYHKQSTTSNRSLVDPDDPYSMIIITDTERELYFDDFVTWKNDHGISTAVFLTSDIYEEYPGIDDQEKIKNFIDDAYITYSGTANPLEYIILGGDDEIIPIRFVFIDTGYGTVDYHMPCDLYYGCLDNNWDGNGNGIYGEVADNVDMVPEVSIGRIPAESESEFSNFFDKTYYYVDNACVSNDIAYLLGENLNWNPLTWGGDYKDEVASMSPNLEQDYHVFRLYDREGTFSTQAVKNAINSGVSIINHMGHSNENMVFGQNIGHTATYTNSEYGFAYTQGCYPAAFDEATSHGSESIGENLIFVEGGLFAFIGNTRYGWYMPGSTNGPSQPYDIEFFKAIFTNNIRELGKALDESRIVLANQAISNAFLRWVHYELVLFGDPSIEVNEANGNFPYIQPVEAIYDDSNLGDGDSIPNPGEQIEIYIELENLEGWADATDVSATISFEDEDIQVLIDSVFYGDIQSGTTSTSSPFAVQVLQDCNYGSYEYYLQVTAPVSGNTSFDKTYTLSFEVSLFQKNWPCPAFNSILSNPIICDFDENGSKELMIIDAYANINLLNINAVQLAGFPWMNEEGMWKNTALADINANGHDEIIMATRTGRIFAIDQNGEFVFEYQNDSENILTPIVADVNGDDSPDIISLDMNRNLIVLDSSGNLLNNFPVTMPMHSFTEMASADINEDGDSEIIIATLDGLLNAIDSSGENISGFPVDLLSYFSSSPIVLDNMNIVVGTNDKKIHVVSNTGEILLSMEVDNKIVCSPIAADFDNDDILEIAFGTVNGKLYIIEQDGTILPGWPVDTEHLISKSPLTADLDNDDNLELICFTSTNDLYVYHNDGLEVDFAPVPIGMVGNTPASLEDIDRDGDFDIISGFTTTIFIIDCKLSKGTKTPWKTYRGNYSRTGFYGDNELVTSADEIVPEIVKAVLNQNYPNPFNPAVAGAGRSPATTISFSLAKNTKHTEIVIYNIKGQKVKTLIDDKLEAGKHSITWNGIDNNGKCVSTGIYFYKLSADSNTIDVKKMLLLR